MKLPKELEAVLRKQLNDEELDLNDKKIISEALIKSSNNNITKEDFILVVKSALRLTELFEQYLE